MTKCRLFAIDDALKTVVEDGLHSKHLFGKNISVSVVKFIAPIGHTLPAKSHHHGEEASFQIVGSCEVIEGVGDAGDRVVPMAPQTGVIIPRGLSHYGTNSFGPEGASMRLNIVTPRRAEFGPEDSVPYYPLKARGEGE